MSLTHFGPMFHFCTPLKTSGNQRFSVIFRGYRNGALVENGLIIMKQHLVALLDPIAPSLKITKKNFDCFEKCPREL